MLAHEAAVWAMQRGGGGGHDGLVNRVHGGICVVAHGNWGGRERGSMGMHSLGCMGSCGAAEEGRGSWWVDQVARSCLLR